MRIISLHDDRHIATVGDDAVDGCHLLFKSSDLRTNERLHAAIARTRSPDDVPAQHPDLRACSSIAAVPNPDGSST